MPEHYQGASSILLLEWWKPVKGFEGFYEVSNTGLLRSVISKFGRPRQRILIPHPDRGYLHIRLFYKGKPRRALIHELVAENFLGPRPEGYEVNHKNGWKPKNWASNLEYVTPQRNKEHASEMGLLMRGETHVHAKLTAANVREIRSLIGTVTKADIARKYGVCDATVRLIETGRNWAWLA